MSRDWESIFQTWSQGPSATERQRAENAERQIHEAVAASQKLKSRHIKVFTQGSYRNRVNVRKDSDVDIGVLCYDTFFPDYPDDNVKSVLEKSLADSDYAYATFKNEIEEALKEEVEFKPLENLGIKAPHFVIYVRGLLEARYGKEVVENGGLKVITTLDWKMQQTA